MKKMLLALCLLLALCCIFAACDDAACQHRDADDNSLCDTCGESFSDNVNITENAPTPGNNTPASDNTASTPEHTHAFGEWSVTTAATCTKKGVETRTCACGESETREVAATGEHSFGEWGVTMAATCTEKGMETRTCDCGESETREVATTGEHSFGEWGVTMAATCTEKGVETRTCACGESETRDVSATGVHVSTRDLKCGQCGARMLYHQEGNYIYFGEYPQTLKANDVKITSFIDSRGYYLGSDNAYYAKGSLVSMNHVNGGKTYSDGSTVIRQGTEYFKVEPIRWRILSQNDDTALILCDSIIANMKFDDDDSNNYAESDIRAWLNAEFYNTAFTELEQNLILTTLVDNSAASTGDTSNRYYCKNTNDKVFLLSYMEATNDEYGFALDTARRMQTSDYSRAMGVYMTTTTECYGNGLWWLRSPNDTFGDARHVDDHGFIDEVHVYHPSIGVVPALQIRLS